LTVVRGYRGGRECHGISRARLSGGTNNVWANVALWCTESPGGRPDQRRPRGVQSDRHGQIELLGTGGRLRVQQPLF
jgi:hypothetical protein